VGFTTQGLDSKSVNSMHGLMARRTRQIRFDRGDTGLERSGSDIVLLEWVVLTKSVRS